MKLADLPPHRLHSQRLAATNFDDPSDAVWPLTRLGGVARDTVTAAAERSAAFLGSSADAA